MTVKIIKQGKMPTEDKFRKTCRKCGCVIEYLRSDLTAICDQYCMQTDYRINGDCPTCKITLWHNEKDKIES